MSATPSTTTTTTKRVEASDTMSAPSAAPAATTITKRVEAIKHDQGKPQFSLLSSPAMQQLTEVLTFGAKKYGIDNWRKGQGLQWRRLYDAMFRHLVQWKDAVEAGRSTADEESQFSHLAHLMCNAMFLLHFESTKTGQNDIVLSSK